jgi:hypothetical protein
MMHAALLAAPVLVELFTSEGCSSCPPADTFLAELDRDQPVPGAEVVILSEHVDYWNGFGWRDPFSAPEFTERQRTYERRLGRDGVYTPQVVVDGRMQGVGSEARGAMSMIASAAVAPKADVRLAMEGERLRIDVGALPQGGEAELHLAITEDGLQSSVARGENRGRTLWHRGVVRQLSRVATVSAGGVSVAAPLRLDPRWKRGKLRAVAFVQRKDGGEVLGVGAMWFPKAGVR